MKRLAVFALAAIAALSPLTIAAVGAAGTSRVDFALEAWDPASGRPLTILHGKNLHRFREHNLRKSPAGALQASADPVSQKKDLLVLALPADTPPGVYVMELVLPSDEVLSVPATVHNGRPLPGSIHLEDLHSSVLADFASYARRTELQPYALKTEIPDPVDVSVLATKDDLVPLARKALKGARCRVSSGTTMQASSDFQAVPFDQTEFDTDGCRYGSAEKVICETEGYYLFTAKVLLPTGSFTAEIRKNGAKVAGDTVYSAYVGTSIAVSAAVHLEVDDYLEVHVKAGDGGSYTVKAGSELSVVKVGE